MASPPSNTKTKAEIIISPSKRWHCCGILFAYPMAFISSLPGNTKIDGCPISAPPLNVALSKVKANMADVEPFTIHDFRRTARTHLAALGIESHIAERSLNHKIKGVEGIYNRHDYFEERKAALQKLANFIEACEKSKNWNVCFTGSRVCPMLLNSTSDTANRAR